MDPYQNAIQQQDTYHEKCLMTIQLDQNKQKKQNNK
jgi:hypothetical protein